VLAAYKDRMDLTDFGSFLAEKCAAQNVAFAGPADFFESRMLAYVEKTWDQWLGPLVPELPAFATVIGELRPQIGALALDAHTEKHAGAKDHVGNNGAPLEPPPRRPQLLPPQ
jgi:hypothetical protein